jgi:hypothetical protein
MTSLDGSRRNFLKTAGALPAAAAAAAPQPVPQIRLGRHTISRVICGANPFNAGSHLSVFFNQELRRYYTPEQVLKTLNRCQQVGINCWQSTSGDLDLHRRLLDEGGKLSFLSLETADSQKIPDLVRAGCVGIAHHGEFTDRMFKQGKIDELRDTLKRFRDSGLLVGVSTHMPAVVDTIESRGWDLDYS